MITKLLIALLLLNVAVLPLNVPVVRRFIVETMTAVSSWYEGIGWHWDGAYIRHGKAAK